MKTTIRHLTTLGLSVALTIGAASAQETSKPAEKAAAPQLNAPGGTFFVLPEQNTTPSVSPGIDVSKQTHVKYADRSTGVYDEKVVISPTPNSLALCVIASNDRGGKELIGPWQAKGVIIRIENMRANETAGMQKLTGGRLTARIVGDKIGTLDGGVWNFDWASAPMVTGTLKSMNGDVANLTKMTKTSAGCALTAT